MNKHRVGIIGCGGIANGKHMPALATVPNVEMVAFCDLILERAEAAAKKFGSVDAKTYTDYHELLAREDIDIVHVCTPNSSHCEISVAAMEAGKHVMCEKPMALNYAQAKLMVDTSKRTGKKLTIGYQMRSQKEFQLARHLVKNGYLGEIYYVRAKCMRRRGIPTWGVFLDYEKQGGGPMIDIGTHALDAAMYIIGNHEVESVMGVSYQKLGAKAAVSNNARLFTPEEYQVEDSAMGFVRFKNGCAMTIEATWAINMEDSGLTPVIVGDKAGLSFENGNIRVNGELDGHLYEQIIHPNKYTRDLFKGNDMDQKEYEAHQWIYAIDNDCDPLVKPEEAAVVSRIIEAIYESAKTGKAVYFD